MNIEQLLTNNFSFILAFSVNGVCAKTNSSVVARAERLINSNARHAVLQRQYQSIMSSSANDHVEIIKLRVCYIHS